jgi:hypothetical protein
LCQGGGEMVGGPASDFCIPAMKCSGGLNLFMFHKTMASQGGGGGGVPTSPTLPHRTLQSNTNDDYRAHTGLTKQDLAAKAEDQYRQYQRQPLNRP